MSSSSLTNADPVVAYLITGCGISVFYSLQWLPGDNRYLMCTSIVGFFCCVLNYWKYFIRSPTFGHVSICSLLLHFAWVVGDAKCIVVTRVCVSVLVFAYNSIIALTLPSSVRTYHALCILLLRFLLSFLISPSRTHVIFLQPLASNLFVVVVYLDDGL